MKKILLSLMALLVCSGAFAQKGDKSVNLSFNYGTGTESLGVALKFNYNLTDAIRLAPNFTYFLKNSGLNLWDINVDFNYLFFAAPKFKLYPVVGLSLATAHYSVKANGEKYTSNETRFGANLGAGLEYDITPEWSMNLEFKYRIMSDIDQGVIGIGVSYRF